jgi:N,N'-diacetyllegionaminate synthase
LLKTIIVAEIGSNWEGKLSIAKKIISECKIAGADAVKFQMWRAKDLYSETHPEWSTIKKSELTFEKAKKIKRITDDLGIEFMCSVFYPEAVTFLESLGVKRYKVASRTCLLKDPFAIETLENKARTKKPVIISMGMGGSKKKIEKIFLKNHITFCYCISDYPLNFKKINWKKAVIFDGFSDHTMDTTAAILFTILKKQKKSKQIIIEKHVKLKTSKGPDASTSIDTEKLSELISHIRIIEKTNF